MRDLVDQARSRIRSIYFEAEFSGRMATTPKGVYRRQHFVFAAKGECRYHEAGHYVDNLLWNEDPEWARRYLRADRIDAVYPLRRAATWSRVDADPATNAKLRDFYYDPYLGSIGWWPPESSPSRAALVPESCLFRVVRHPHCRVLPGTRLIGDRPCVALEIKERGETFYIDPQRGGALVRRESRLADGTQVICQNSAFREVAPGTWLPAKARQVVFRGDFASLDEVPEPARWTDNTYSLSRIEINNVQDSQFVYEPLPGTILYEREAGRITFVPGGTDFIDVVLGSARKRVDDRAPARDGGRFHAASVPLLLLLLAAPPWVLILCRRRFGM